MAYNNIIAKKLFIAKCDKCLTGMVYIEHDSIDGDSTVCYQCGRRKYLETPSLPKTNKQTY